MLQKLTSQNNRQRSITELKSGEFSANPSSHILRMCEVRQVSLLESL